MFYKYTKDFYLKKDLSSFSNLINFNQYETLNLEDDMFEIISNHIIFLLQNYSSLEQKDKFECTRMLRHLFSKKPNLNFFNHIIESLKNPESIEIFSQIFLSEIAMKPNLISEYSEIDIPQIALNLMKMFPEETFNSLIGIFTKTLTKLDRDLFYDITQLMRVSDDVSLYGKAIYKFAEMSWKMPENFICKLVQPIEMLIAGNEFKYPIKIYALLCKNNDFIKFVFSFKNIIKEINALLISPCLDQEDIFNSLIIIRQCVEFFKQISGFCSEFNYKFICSLVDSSDLGIKLMAIDIVSFILKETNYNLGKLSQNINHNWHSHRNANSNNYFSNHFMIQAQNIKTFNNILNLNLNNHIFVFNSNSSLNQSPNNTMDNIVNSNVDSTVNNKSNNDQNNLNNCLNEANVPQIAIPILVKNLFIELERSTKDIAFEFKLKTLDDFIILTFYMNEAQICEVVTDDFYESILNYIGSDDPLILMNTIHLCKIITRKSEIIRKQFHQFYDEFLPLIEFDDEKVVHEAQEFLNFLDC
ncbi:hypothetical protein TRFO_26934 [Tritrichomonas foetus]|uniref:Uncharacterized protein n=1 Tax=Tritrichomonas foetus TaxID=1144522 RepID=A0A1J4K2X0_9EUKA|nr:hypothetical protein TRFO_26934 [Tritrichomonas foetus]|eukprot:OHT05314.1 hypothetical protein TRFO_26934 [Tritrichomonas foetus]